MSEIAPPRTTDPRAFGRVAVLMGGTSEWLVMPGAVFTSSRCSWPLARSRITSTRPQPVQPAARNASSAMRRICSSSAPSRPGHRYWVSSAMYLAL